MKNDKLYKIITGALFAALCCVATIVIQIPSPMNGYVNLGDSVVLLSGWILGPTFGGLAAGIGSMLADVITGYVHYAPGTFIIKALVAMVGYLLYWATRKVVKNHTAIARVISGIVAESVMVVGYFFYASLLLGKGWAAAASIPGNLIQGLVGVVVSVVLMEVLVKSKALPKFLGAREYAEA